MNRSVDRLLAFLVLAVALACLAHLYLLPGTFALSRLAHPLADAASLRLVAFLAAALVCALGALLFWQGLLPGWPGRQRGARLFGRAAEVQVSGRPRLRLVFLALPMLAVLALLADQFGPWRTGGEVPAEPKGQDVADAPPPAPAAPSPVTPAPPPEQVVKTPPPAEPAPVTPPALAPAPEEPPKTALAPAPPQAAPPPQTVAPPPPSAPPQPTQPDGHRDAVVWLAVSADGHQIMSASTDRMIKLWDIDGKRLIRDVSTRTWRARRCSCPTASGH
ncbi:hypothetical protein ACFX5Q_21510 [Mesorhizobium sp. IMUNJ 23033]|uniref:hypothetical protein n=1 Tax=Mesorhizobium sp. IMUNJ 23033 TaxID=3378039 RepID=UPI00384C1FD9